MPAKEPFGNNGQGTSSKREWNEMGHLVCASTVHVCSFVRRMHARFLGRNVFFWLFWVFVVLSNVKGKKSSHQQREPDDDHEGKRTLSDASFYWSGVIRQSNILSCVVLRCGYDENKIVETRCLCGPTELRLCWQQFFELCETLKRPFLHSFETLIHHKSHRIFMSFI